ncbi:amidohydrolase [Bacillus gobiensis]|uniref:amidohydrolase n=1 Tax=Bacillus gobiensis TaxID=1441095 RepID=UPI003D22622D
MKSLWYGGTIYTMEKEGHTVDSVVVEDGQILDTGSYQAMKEKYIDAKEQHLKGATMFPGFVDSHLHLIGHGEKLIRLDLSMCTSKEEIIKKIRLAETDVIGNDWLIGEGWNENRFSDPSYLTKEDLDEFFPDRPVLLKRICRHAIVVNSKALHAAGITKQTPDPEGGVIVRNENGNPAGLLHDKAQELVYQVLPSVDSDYLNRALRSAIQDCYEKGLTGGHSEDLSYYGLAANPMNAYQEVIANEGLLFRAHLLVHHLALDEWLQLDKKESPYIEYGAMKLFADGALGGRTALLKEPYHDDPDTNGVEIHKEKELYELVEKARQHHMEVAVHAIGDLAFEKVLSVLEKLPPHKGRHDRIIHAQVVNSELVKKAAKLPVCLDLQPHFLASDFPWAIDRLGEERVRRSFVWKTLLKAGIPCAGGSDAPIEPVSPILGIQSAVLRKSSQPGDETVYNEGECLSVFEAVSLYTKGSAAIIYKENKRGMIKKGYDADFTILDKDLFQMEKEYLHLATVQQTVIAGEIVYRRKKAGAS